MEETHTDEMAAVVVVAAAVVEAVVVVEVAVAAVGLASHLTASRAAVEETCTPSVPAIRIKAKTLSLISPSGIAAR